MRKWLWYRWLDVRYWALAGVRRVGLAAWWCERKGHRLGPTVMYWGIVTTYGATVRHESEKGRYRTCDRCGESFYDAVEFQEPTERSGMISWSEPQDDNGWTP